MTFGFPTLVRSIEYPLKLTTWALVDFFLVLLYCKVSSIGTIVIQSMIFLKTCASIHVTQP